MILYNAIFTFKFNFFRKWINMNVNCWFIIFLSFSFLYPYWYVHLHWPTCYRGKRYGIWMVFWFRMGFICLYTYCWYSSLLWRCWIRRNVIAYVPQPRTFVPFWIFLIMHLLHTWQHTDNCSHCYELVVICTP